MSPNPAVYIIIAVHNRIQETLECLSCITRQTYRDYQIVIVDDGSTDGTAEQVRQHFPQAVVLKGNSHLWWTGAMHQGVEYVLQRAQPDDYILSLNNDVTFAEDYLERLVAASKHYGGAIVGSLCRDYHDHTILHDVGITMKWKVYSYGQLAYDPAKEAVTDVATISGRGALIPTGVFRRIGNYNKKLFPHYGADYEFGFRAKRAGVPLVVSYRAIVYLKNDLTGFRPTRKVLSYGDTCRRLFSIKSPANLFVHIKTVYVCCPLSLNIRLRILFFIIAGNMYIAARDVLLYTLIKIHIIHDPDNI